MEASTQLFFVVGVWYAADGPERAAHSLPADSARRTLPDHAARPPDLAYQAARTLQ
jgi:hypothetical protein